jgi:serine-type D-Ala-D-Ala carboxypeptidase
LLPAFSGQDAQFQRAFDVLRSGMAERAFPGASVAITHRGRLVANKGLGHFTYDLDSPAVAAETVYDLASVTKVVATTAACMLLYERGQFELEQPLVEILPGFAGLGSQSLGSKMNDPRRQQVTLRMLLAHSSGLPAYIKLFQTSHNKEELLTQALQVPLTADPGSRAEYSDIGFILLGQALEHLTGQPLDQFCQTEIFAKLGLAHSTFNPLANQKPFIPPTEDDRTFRHRLIQGEVNDENASVMGGVAGHAGCFSMAANVSEFAHCMLLGGTPLVQRETQELFTRREDFPPGTSRALGWDTPSQPSQSGKYFSSRAYGHLGYTGTSLWIDPDRQLSVTLLTNRTWPDRGSQSIKQIRPLFHDAVIEAMD